MPTMCADELEDLLRRAAAGEREAAGELARRYADPIRDRIRRKLGPTLRARVDTDDIFQSTIATVLGDLDQIDYRGEPAFVAWLATAAENRLRMAGRRHQAGKRDLRRDRRLEAAGGIIGGRTSPTEGAVRGELVDWLKGALEGLPALEREVVRLHSFEGLSFPEIAARLDLPSKDVARRTFKRALRGMGDAFPTERLSGESGPAPEARPG